MGYFDDPRHRAEWEKELSALREEKARIQAGMPRTDHSVSNERERTAPERITPERTVPERTAPERIVPERERFEGTYRIKMTFEELLREEGIDPVQKVTRKPKEMERQKEVSYEL